MNVQLFIWRCFLTAAPLNNTTQQTDCAAWKQPIGYPPPMCLSPADAPLLRTRRRHLGKCAGTGGVSGCDTARVGSGWREETEDDENLLR